MKFQQGDPKLQVNRFDGYATFIIAQACGMREEPQVNRGAGSRASLRNS